MAFARNLVIAVVVVAAVLLVYSYFQSEAPIKSWMAQKPAAPAADAQPAGGQNPESTSPPALPLQEERGDPQDSESAGVSRPEALTLEEIRQLLSLVEKNQRLTLLEDEEKFRNFITSEANNRSIDAAARANKIDQNEKNQLVVHLGAGRILREIYLKQLISSKIPRDFPSAEQIETYYDQNKDNFALPDRMPVWQIFLATPAGMEPKDIELRKKEAESIITDLGKNKMDFAEAALKYSTHQQSKYNGGFLGIVNIKDMKPEIQKVLQALPPDKISQAVRSEEGIHILKRGPLLAKYTLPLDDVREQIRQQMIKQATNELRQAIYAQAAKTYPVDVDEQRREAWRQQILAEQPPTP